jgi:hypothetical protein
VLESPHGAVAIGVGQVEKILGPYEIETCEQAESCSGIGWQGSGSAGPECSGQALQSARTAAGRDPEASRLGEAARL